MCDTGRVKQRKQRKDTECRGTGDAFRDAEGASGLGTGQWGTNRGARRTGQLPPPSAGSPLWGVEAAFTAQNSPVLPLPADSKTKTTAGLQLLKRPLSLQGSSLWSDLPAPLMKLFVEQEPHLREGIPYTASALSVWLITIYIRPLVLSGTGFCPPRGTSGNTWSSLFFFCHNWIRASSGYRAGIDTARHPTVPWKALHKDFPPDQ